MGGALTATGLGAALILAGLGFGTPSLLVPGIGLTGLALVAGAWVELARPRLLVREPGPARVVEGERFSLRIVAVGARTRPPGGALSDPVLPEPVAIGPRWRGTVATSAALGGRGRRRLHPARLEIRDPLGLWIRVIESEDPGELLVLPRIEPVVVAGQGAAGSRHGPLAGLEDGVAASRLDARAIEFEMDGLRMYREGSPASRIHWPAVARTGDLIERRLVAGADAAPLVALDASNPAGPEQLDAAVRAAASLCFHLGRRGGCAALLPKERRPVELEPDLRGWPHLHARFALVEATAAPPAVPRAPRSGAIFWVTARARPALPAGLRSGGPGLRWLVAPGLAAHGQRGFSVAGCEGRAIGSRAAVRVGSAA